MLNDHVRGANGRVEAVCRPSGDLTMAPLLGLRWWMSGGTGAMTNCAVKEGPVLKCQQMVGKKLIGKFSEDRSDDNMSRHHCDYSLLQFRSLTIKFYVPATSTLSFTLHRHTVFLAIS